jgi:hypothetical protein
VVAAVVQKLGQLEMLQEEVVLVVVEQILQMEQMQQAAQQIVVQEAAVEHKDLVVLLQLKVAMVLLAL